MQLLEIIISGRVFIDGEKGITTLRIYQYQIFYYTEIETFLGC